MIRLLLGILLSPFRLFRWAIRRLYVAIRGYDLVRVRIHGGLADRGGAGGLSRFIGRDDGGPALLDLLVAFDRIARDPRVRTLFVELGPLASGAARAEELRNALSKVRDAGKRVIVYLEDARLVEYLAAIGGSELVLSPAGGLNVTGVRSEVLFLRGFLDQVGVRAWFSARGKYKSMRETFTEHSMTAANREMTESIVGDLYDQVVAAIAESRRVAPELVRELLDRGPFSATEAKTLGLVDSVRYLDEIETELEKSRELSLGSYLRLSTHLIARGRPTRVALLQVGGHIKSGDSSRGPGTRATGSRAFVEQVKKVADDPRIRAIVLRVDSPGGSALASDIMWRALSRAREKKPIVVSMVDVAASGGYFVSGIRETPIFASRATLTGSIGVVGGKFEFSELYRKLGIKKETIARGLHSGFYSESRGLDDDELRKLEADIDEHYRHFVSRMAEGRARTPEEIDRVAQGRVFTGRQALEVGLVDEQGGLFAALAKVRSLLGKDERSPLALIGGARRRFPLKLEWRGAEQSLGEALLQPLRLLSYFSHERVLAIMPFEIRFF